jgi:hypothetical protein
MFQFDAANRVLSGRTFDPKVAGSIPARPIERKTTWKWPRSDRISGAVWSQRNTGKPGLAQLEIDQRGLDRPAPVADHDDMGDVPAKLKLSQQ